MCTSSRMPGVVTLLVALAAVQAVVKVEAQDCLVRGRLCSDSAQCCGGCCFNGVCYDTYRSCLQPLDVCKDHSCLDEETCETYIPPQCPGCEPIPVCR